MLLLITNLLNNNKMLIKLKNKVAKENCKIQEFYNLMFNLMKFIVKKLNIEFQVNIYKKEDFQTLIILKLNLMIKI